MKLCRVIPYLNTIYKYVNHVTNPRVLLTSAFFSGNQQFLLYQEIDCILIFNFYFLFNFFLVFNGFSNKHGSSFDDVCKIDCSSPS